MPRKPSDDVIDLYHRKARAWAELRRYDLFEQSWLDRFLALMPRSGRDVLDLGCGSGRPIADYLIANGCRVTGVDGARSLIGMAKEAFPEQTWIVADMRRMRLNGRFHGLIAWHSLIHLTPGDQRPMFATFDRLAHPGAALVFTSGTSLGDAHGTFAGRTLYHGSLDTREYRELLEVNNFDVVAHVEDEPTCGGANVWLARKRPDDG